MLLIHCIMYMQRSEIVAFNIQYSEKYILLIEKLLYDQTCKQSS